MQEVERVVGPPAQKVQVSGSSEERWSWRGGRFIIAFKNGKVSGMNRSFDEYSRIR
jgi:hypothetical protein